MKRIARRFNEFKYVAVREFQERGAIHYHLAINTFIRHEQLAELWRNGFVWIEKPVKNQNHLSNYICKYLSKHSNDERLKGYHSYLHSQGLSLPVQDNYFRSSDEMINYLQIKYDSKMKDKKICSFEDGQIVWVG